MTIAGHGNGLRPVRFRLLAVRVSNAIAYVILNVWSNDAYVKGEKTLSRNGGSLLVSLLSPVAAFRLHRQGKPRLATMNVGEGGA